jgi:hypothetical protein
MINKVLPVPKSRYTGAYGWETDLEEDNLILLARMYCHFDPRILEIGAEYGRSASAFAYALTQSDEFGQVEIHSLDLFPTDHGTVGDLLAFYKQTISQFEGKAKIKIEQGKNARRFIFKLVF